MPVIALTTFLKLCAKTPTAKATAYGKYFKPGGYDFYSRLKAMARAMTVDGAPYSECEQVILGIESETERENNLLGLKSFRDWLETQKRGIRFFAPASAICRSPKGYLGVRLAPEFGIETAEGRRLVTLWNAKTPAMSQRVAAPGIYLKQQYLRKEEFSDCSCALLDLRSKSMLLSQAVPRDVAESVAKELAWADWFFEQADEKSEEPSLIGALLR